MTKTKTKTKCMEDPTYAIFLKSRGFKDTDAEITKTKTKFIEDQTFAVFLKSRGFKDIKYDHTRLQSRGPNSRTCVPVAVHLLLTFTLLNM